MPSRAKSPARQAKSPAPIARTARHSIARSPQPQRSAPVTPGDAAAAARLQLLIQAAVFVDLVGVALVVPNLIFRWKELGITPESLGAVQSIYSAAQLVGGLVIGHLGDRILGRKNVLLLSFVGAGISYLLVGLAQSIHVLVLARVIVGLTKQTMTSSSALLTRLSTPEGRAQALGRLSSASTLAFTCGQAVGGVLSSRYGRSVPCFIAAALFAADFLVVLLLLPSDRPSTHLPAPPQRTSARLATKTDAKAVTDADIEPARGDRLAAIFASFRARLGRLGGFVSAFRGAGGKVLAMRLVYAFLMRATYSLHGLYEQQKWQLTPATTGFLSTYKMGLGLAVDALLIGHLTRRLGETSILTLALAVSAANAALEAAHSTLYVYTLINLPVSTVVGTLTRTTLSTLFSKTVPVADVGAALSVFDVCSSAVGMTAPLYGGVLLGKLGVMAQPMLSCAHYLLLLGLAQLTIPRAVRGKKE